MDRIWTSCMTSVMFEASSPDIRFDKPCCTLQVPSPVPDHQLNAGLRRSLQSFVGLVRTPSSRVLPVDLQDLVPKAQPSQGSGGVSLHQLDKHSLRETDKTFKV